MCWLAQGASQDTCDNFIFVDIQPTGNFQKVFHAEHLLCNRIGRKFARGNTDFAVLPIKGATICCAQGQNIYIEKRCADPPRCNQT